MERKSEEQYPSLGLLSIAAYLREAGQDVEIIDLTFERGLERVRSRARSFRPDVVGVHTKTLTEARSLSIAKIAHRLGAVAIAGGPDASSRPENYLHGSFDAVVTGEGESTLLEVVRALQEKRSLFGIPGVCFRHEGSTVRGPSRPLLRNLDDLPLPAWDLIDMEGYLARWERSTGTRRMAVLTSRGCPFDCSWCSKPTFGRTFRQRSVTSVLRELRALQEHYRVDYVRICDDVFGIQRAWTEQFLDALADEPVRLRFECLSRVDLLRPELLPRMSRAGLSRVFLGVESGSQRMLDLMNRGTNLSQIHRCSRALRAHGVRQYWFLMLGYPGETLEDIEQTFQLFRTFGPEEYSISVAVPLPGTRLERLVSESSLHHLAERDMGRLYEGVYPPAVYSWEKARFRWSKVVNGRAGQFDPQVVRALERGGDEVARNVVSKIVLSPGGPVKSHGPVHPAKRRVTVPRSLQGARARAEDRLDDLRVRLGPYLTRRLHGLGLRRSP